MGSGIISREHWHQSLITVSGLALTGASMLAGAVWFLSAQIAGVRAADFELMQRQWTAFETSRAALEERVTVIETDQRATGRTMDHLTTAVDALAASVTSQTVVVAKLQQTLEDRRR
jgi:hypothetical protein